MNEWDVIFVVFIGFFSLMLINMIYFYLAHQCPVNETGIFIGEEFVCIDRRFIDQQGSDEYLYSILIIKDEVNKSEESV